MRPSLSFTLIIAAACLQVNNDSAQIAAAQVGSVDTSPSQSPWTDLDDMPEPLGRFVLASDQDRIYRLGGIGFNIRRGQRYGHRFASYDPAQQAWQKLPSVSLGTGGAQLAVWPAKQSVVMIGGIKKLGDKFPVHGVHVGVYSIPKRAWKSKFAPARGLGRVSAMIHLEEDQFLLIAGDDGLSGHRTAILDLTVAEKPAVKMVGEFPKNGRTIGIAKIDQTVFTLHGGQGNATLQQFSLRSGEHAGSVDLSCRCEWTDKLLAWKGNLLIWKNFDAAQAESYDHASRMLLIGADTGHCQTLHPQFAGPQARRSSEGVVFNDSFYLFGGQGEEKDWRQDAHRYDFVSQSDSTSAVTTPRP